MKIIGVYGTLRKEQNANYKLDNCNYLGIFEEELPLQMYNLGWYPALTKSESNNKITLELYEVNEDVEKDLDRYEGYPNLYQKTIVKVADKDVTVYTMNKLPRECVDNVVQSGDWLNR